MARINADGRNGFPWTAAWRTVAELPVAGDKWQRWTLKRNRVCPTTYVTIFRQKLNTYSYMGSTLGPNTLGALLALQILQAWKENGESGSETKQTNPNGQSKGSRMSGSTSKQGHVVLGVHC